VATVRSICTDALTEIGVLGEAEVMTAAQGQLALLRFQNQIDAWAADRLTLSVQSRTLITWPASTSSQTIGPLGDINVQRPVWVNSFTYVIPGTNPGVESEPLGPMDDDSYASQSIKELSSALPQQFYYQTSIDTLLGTLILWPVPSQELTMYLYAPQAVGVPVDLDSILLGPPGYQEAFMYQLAIRMARPFGRAAVLPDLRADATRAFARMKSQNVDPGLLGMDGAATMGTVGGYNILSDNQSAPGGRN